MPAGARWLTWLEQSAFAVWAREATWAYPALETAHIVGFTVLVGAAVIFDLRLLGFARALPIAASARYLLAWSFCSLLLVVPTGFALFAAHATSTWLNPAFRLKLLLLAIAGANALVFRVWTSASIETWDGLGGPTPLSARIAALVSIVAWTGVITCGRLIAYL